ncbi:MAG TPA: TraB family protein, partial [Arenimonas sp.]|nr:TraB family protein [Arenimonas sp.]
MNNNDFAGQPVIELTVNGIEYTLLGTAHVSAISVEAVKQAIDSNAFDTIAVELDTNRHKQLTEESNFQKLDIFQIIKEDKIGLVAANLSLAAYQRRLADQLGIEPGAELKAAAIEAKTRNLRCELIDRDAGITLKRAWARLGFFKRSQLAAGLGTSLLSSDEISEQEIEQLKEGDMLESSFGEFAKQTPELYETIIHERDKYMAAKLLLLSNHSDVKRVLAVVGAGHLKGLAEQMQKNTAEHESTIQSLEHLKKPSNIPWFSFIVISVLLFGFYWGYQQGGTSLAGTMLIQWILITGLG